MPVEAVLNHALACRDRLEQLKMLDAGAPGARENFDASIERIRGFAANDLRPAASEGYLLAQSYPFLDGIRFTRNLFLALIESHPAPITHLTGRPGLYYVGENIYFIRSDRMRLRQANITLVSKNISEYVGHIIYQAQISGGPIRSVLVEGTGPSAAFAHRRTHELLPGGRINWDRPNRPMLGFGFETEIPYRPFQDMALFLNDTARSALRHLNPCDLVEAGFGRCLEGVVGIPAARSAEPQEPEWDIHIISYGISPGYAPLVGELHESTSPPRIPPGIHTSWMRPLEKNFGPTSGSDPPLCLVSGASGSAAMGLLTLFARRIPEGEMDAVVRKFLDTVNREFPGLYDDIANLVLECAGRLASDSGCGCDYQPDLMNNGAWAAMQEFCANPVRYAQILKLLTDAKFSADINLVLHARAVSSEGGRLTDPFGGMAGPLLSLINYPLLKRLHDEGRLISLDSRATSTRAVAPGLVANTTRCRVVISRSANGHPDQNPRDLWTNSDDILTVERGPNGLRARWTSLIDARLPEQLPEFDYACLSYGPRPEANLAALQSSNRIGIVSFLRAMTEEPA